MPCTFGLADIFNKILNGFLDDYHSENDKDYLLRSNLDYEFFVRNRCPNWIFEFGFADMEGLDIDAVNHYFNLCCYAYFRRSLLDRGLICDLPNH